MSADLQRLALARDIARRLPARSHDELRVVDRVLQRLELGAQLYGPLDLASDRRDWRRERFEERLDALVYDVAGELAAEDRARADLHEAARSELVNEWRGEQPTAASPIPEQLAAVMERERVELDDIADDSGPYASFDTSDVDGVHPRGQP